MTRPLFLDRAELQALTGRTRPGAQRRALAAMGVPHRVRPDGQPVVAVRDLAKHEEQHTEIHQPNWSALLRTPATATGPDGGTAATKTAGISG